MALAAVVAASAEDFPLTFHAIAAKDVVAFPGGYGTMAQLRLAKPAGLKTEPKAVSSHPLYGECRETPTGRRLRCFGWMNPKGRARAMTSSS